MKVRVVQISLAALALMLSGAVVMYSGADIATQPELHWRVMEIYGDDLAERVFDPAAEAPESWLQGLRLETLKSMSVDQLQGWLESRDTGQGFREWGFSLHDPGEPLLEALVDVCVVEAKRTDSVTAERLGVIEELALKLARRAARHAIDPLLLWLRGTGWEHHPGRAGDLVCRIVARSNVRPVWPRPISPADIDSTTDPHKLLAGLSDENPSTRAAAAVQITTHQENGAMMLMLAALRDGHPDVRLAAVLALERRAEERWPL